jgi:hypothetical protein
MLRKIFEPLRAASLTVLVLPIIVTAQVQSAGQGFSAQKPGSGEPPKALIYREPSKPITIGEMSEMQAAAMRTAFLERMGYTKTPPPPPPPRKVKAEKPVVLWTFRPTAIWGPNDLLSAEALVDGQLTLIRAGQSLFRSEDTNIIVKAISPNSLVLSVTSQTSKKGTKGTKDTTVSTERHHAIRVGQQLEQAL